LFAQEDSDAKFIALAAAPFTIKHVNKAWCQMYSLSEDKAVGRSLRVIQGPGTSAAVFMELKGKVAAGKKFTTPITTVSALIMVLCGHAPAVSPEQWFRKCFDCPRTC
jgi:hypothetical protein